MKNVTMQIGNSTSTMRYSAVIALLHMQEQGHLAEGLKTAIEEGEAFQFRQGKQIVTITGGNHG